MEWVPEHISLRLAFSQPMSQYRFLSLSVSELHLLINRRKFFSQFSSTDRELHASYKLPGSWLLAPGGLAFSEVTEPIYITSAMKPMLAIKSPYDCHVQEIVFSGKFTKAGRVSSGYPRGKASKHGKRDTKSEARYEVNAKNKSHGDFVLICPFAPFAL